MLRFLFKQSVAGVLLFVAGLFFQPEALALKTWTYGNYCGKGKGHGKPIDRVDAACKQHDECCVQKGVIQATIWGFCHCSCDQRFKAQIKQAASQSKSRKEKKAAKQILFYISNTFCNCGKARVCTTVPKCSRKRVCRRIAKKKVCNSKLVCKKTKQCKALWRVGFNGGPCYRGKKWMQTLKKLKLLKK